MTEYFGHNLPQSGREMVGHNLAPSIADAVLSYLEVTGPQADGVLPVGYTVDKPTGFAWGIGTSLAGATDAERAANLRAGSGMLLSDTGNLTVGGTVEIPLEAGKIGDGLSLFWVLDGSNTVVTAAGGTFDINTTTGFTEVGVANNSVAHMWLDQGIIETPDAQKLLIYFAFSPSAKTGGRLLDLGDKSIVFQDGSNPHKVGCYVEATNGSVIQNAGNRSDPLEVGDRVHGLIAIQAGGALQIAYKINAGAWVVAKNDTNPQENINVGDQLRVGVLAEDIGNGNGVAHGSLYRMAVWVDQAAALPNITTAAVQNLFCNAAGALIDPEISHAAYGDAASGGLRFDFYGNAAAANAGIHAGAAGGGVFNSSGGFTNA